MSVTHRITHSLASDGAGGLSGAQEELGATEIKIDKNYAAGTSNELLSVAFTTAGLQSIFLLSDKNLTIETNDGTTPDDTIDLVAGTPFVWSKSPGYFPNPFGTDVTAFYVTCATAARLKGRILKA